MPTYTIEVFNTVIQEWEVKQVYQALEMAVYNWDSVKSHYPKQKCELRMIYTLFNQDSVFK